ncbi:HAMP domain-containing protein,histidine kinase [Sphaerochaeta pleomorpha str. Grapes]|uniref:HAMP domain-containing protein,histidine kinase n=1 Tax=Sphaerochaeta pleomorpha (strain ATCC BAA-1885 / DSM 22778 / Grapes) TaxID=158190 RepID=G8QRT4_SPHPG|nr:sensor histidine kinase [Sphaerochaeta pleomorpha]AEV28867.1 HAMP domain-containing protein,histidine kinase [Sphaerochaeta pleomorpha str. Grapes]
MEKMPRKNKRKSLFTKLFSNFMVVLIIPLGLFASYYTLNGDRNQARYLKGQTSTIVKSDADTLSSVIEAYRHKAYLLSTDPLVISILQEDSLDANSPSSRKLYQLLFDVMKGDTYLASTHIISNSGKVRVSTHEFPEVYDLRYQGNDWDLGNVITQNEKASPTASTISITSPRVAETGRLVIASILRRVYDREGTVYGYLVVDIYSDALTADINKSLLLGEELLFDTSHYYATSLIHSEKHGTFEQFPLLAELKGNFSRNVSQFNDTILAIEPIEGTSLSLAGSISSVPFQQNLNQWLFAFGIMMGIGIVLAAFLSYFFSRTIARPIGNLALSMKAVEEGNLNTKGEDMAILEFAQLDHSFNAMVLQIISLLQITREEQANLAEAERQALESQMNPHFLFNTLNTIKALAKLHGEEEIYTITIKLGKLLRSTIDNHKSECSLKESMSLVDSYLTIQKIRFGDKLHVETQIEESCLEVMTPKLIIQPLVENSIVHGLEPKAGEWNISVKIRREESMVFLCIEDDGIGFPPGSLPTNLDDLANSTHVGVYNVYRRLVLKYGKQMTFSLTSQEGLGTLVTMSFPAGQ